MLTLDPYRAYEESSVAGGDPVNLVVALYDGALASIRTAKTCLENRDILSRGKAISKAMNIVSELMASLDQERGGDISSNLLQIYLYVYKRLMDGHTQQRREPLDEAENLLCTLLSGWKKVAEEQVGTELSSDLRQANSATDTADADVPYGLYFVEGAGLEPTVSVAC